MKLDLIIPNIIYPAYDLLPNEMSSNVATAMLLATGLQESEFKYREQVGGPAHGYWQFEKSGGVHGVRSHPLTSKIIDGVLKELDYPNADDVACYYAITDNDILACCFARLLLWTIADPLPLQGEFEESWLQYLQAWRPGKPHRDKWTANYAHAWKIVRDYNER